MSQEIKNDNSKLAALSGYLSIEYESVSAKELDELREKAEAFDFLSGMGEFQFMPSPEYCSLFNDEESSVTEGDNLLDCVKQARECEG